MVRAVTGSMSPPNLGERLQLAELRLIGFQRTGHFLHTLYLGITTDTRYGDTYVDGGTDTLVEECGLKEYLTVGDRDHVGRDICRHVAGLGFDHGECGERATTLHDRLHCLGEVVHLARHLLVADDSGRTFEQTRMEIEDIAGIGLTSGGTLQDKRDLAIGHSLLGRSS